MSPSGTKQQYRIKNYKLDGKNKRSLHQKQLQQSELLDDEQGRAHDVKASSSNKAKTDQVRSSRSPSNQSNRSSGSNSSGQMSKKDGSTSSSTSVQVCTSLSDFTRRAQELKADIKLSLDKQLVHQVIDQPTEVMELKREILSLSTSNSQPDADAPLTAGDEMSVKLKVEGTSEQSEPETQTKEESIQGKDSSPSQGQPAEIEKAETQRNVSSSQMVADDKSGQREASQLNRRPASVVSELDKKLDDALSALSMNGWSIDVKADTIASNLINSNHDQHQLIKSLSRRLAVINEQLNQSNSNLRQELESGRKLDKANAKLKELCRELQKSNNAIRIESLDLIKVEQTKAKEQTTKIQSTLSGVIKLFDENQQRNMSLRQENQELQVKLKSLLDHCDSWEKSVEIAIRQRDIDNRLLKTELAKANLSRNEDKEKFLGEKQELLQILSIMQEQQHKIEGQEAKLRLDLSSYASKYDECQAVISKGMDKFQIESKKMLKQIEKSKQDYKVLLTKYEATNRKMAQLLEEKQYWDRAMSIANRKVETLEKLCRALREQKPGERSPAPSAQISEKQLVGKKQGKRREQEQQLVIPTTQECPNNNSNQDKLPCHDAGKQSNDVEDQLLQPTTGCDIQVNSSTDQE